MKKKENRIKVKTIKEVGFVADFRKFINKGNVVDMAVGIIVGGAFSKIVTSLVNDILMPMISMITGNINLADASITLRAAVLNDAGEVAKAAVLLNYGQFLQYIIDFLIISLCIFAFVRLFAKLREIEDRLENEKKEEVKKEETPAPPPEPTKEEVLLTEIRDLLKEQKS